MSKLLCVVIAGSALAFGASANAATVIGSEVFSGNVAQYGAPNPTNPPVPAFFTQPTGSIQNQTLSPYASNTNYGTGGGSTWQYDALSVAGSNTPGSVTFNLANTQTLAFLWGSPDSYNSMTFYSGLGGTGSVTGTFTGASLSCFSTTCADTLYDLVTFNLGGALSMTLVDSGQAAFEFGFNNTATPLPAALPLFAGGLGVVGLLARRKKRKGVTALSAIA